MLRWKTIVLYKMVLKAGSPPPNIYKFLKNNILIHIFYKDKSFC